MKAFFCLFIYLYLQNSLNADRRICPESEIWQRCKKPCEITCQRPYVPRCSIYICRPGCICKAGLIRDEQTGICVNPRYCPGEGCPDNEVRSNGKSRCEATCQEQGPRYQCPVQNRRCVCERGFVRESSGKCISPEHCPQECGEEEEWRECSDINCRETCQKRAPSTCSGECTRGCSCKSGTVWDDYDQKCVPLDQCAKVCDENSEWSESIPEHAPTCQKLLEHGCLDCEDDSVFIDGGTTMLPPRPGCICTEGFILDEASGECVLIENCPDVSSTTVISTTVTDSSSTTTDGTTETSTSTSTSSDFTTDLTTDADSTYDDDSESATFDFDPD